MSKTSLTYSGYFDGCQKRPDGFGKLSTAVKNAPTASGSFRRLSKTPRRLRETFDNCQKRPDDCGRLSTRVEKHFIIFLQ
ncbi:MAG: hypothetical protein LBF08_04690 [Dysgonamonadaceae bacterium]|nr:hypothetical protein [Dysgonamonadaceae bacterium]